MTFMETYDMIQNLKERFNEKGYATKIFHREEYHDVLCILSNEGMFCKDRSVHLKVNVQDGIITVSLRRKRV